MLRLCALANYFTWTPIAKKDENICCNHVVVPDFVPFVSFTFKDKSVYIPPHKRNQKVERKTLNPKPSFRSQLKVLDGSKFVPTCHYCGVIGHIRPQCSLLKKKQNHVDRSLFKRPCEHKPIVCHHCGAFGHLKPHYFSFKLLIESKEKRNLSFLEVVLWKQNRIWRKMVSCWDTHCLCASPIFILPTLVSFLMRHSFQTIVPFGWRKVPMVELMLFWFFI